MNNSNEEIDYQLLLASINHLMDTVGNTVKQKNRRDKKAGKATIDSRKNDLKAYARRLWKLGYKIRKLENLQERHVKALFQNYIETGAAQTTIRKLHTTLTQLCDWLGRPSLVKPLDHYFSPVQKSLLNPHTLVGRAVKSDPPKIDLVAIIKKADHLDKKFGLMLRMRLAFGMKRNVLTHDFRPANADLGDCIRVSRKGFVKIETSAQRVVLDMVKEAIGLDAMTWKYKQNGKKENPNYCDQRYSQFLIKVGITRDVTAYLAESCKDFANVLAEIPPPALGDAWKAAPNAFPIHVTEKAIIGGFQLNKEESQWKQDIEAALQYCSGDALDEVSEERLEDCGELVKEIYQLLHVDVRLREVQYLWKIYSKKYTCEWKPIGETNVKALSDAAIKLLHKMAPDKNASLE